MRLRIKECLEVYNDVNDTSLTMRDLAVMVYKDEASDPATQINRLSALNTGRNGFVASIVDVRLICDTLRCECDDLIGD